MLPASTVSVRLRDLGEHFADLADRVRAAVAEAVGDTLARVARDAVFHFLHRTPGRPRSRPPVYSPREDLDPWAEPDPWHDPDRYGRDDTETVLSAAPLIRRPSVVALAAGLGAAGWWLRRGSPAGAAVAGFSAGLLALLVPKVATDGIDLVEGARALLGLQGGLAAGALRLASR